MDGNDEVSEDVIESHLSCFDSGSDAGCEGDFSCEGGVDVDVGAPGKTDCARIRQQGRGVVRAAPLVAPYALLGRRTSRYSFECPALSFSADQIPRVGRTGRGRSHGGTAEVLPAACRLT